MSTEREDGQTTIEFALVLPLLLILVLGVFEFGRAWNAHQVITDAAREGARVGVIADPDVTEDSVLTVVRGALERAALDPDLADITLLGVDDESGTPARVAISYPYRFAFLEALLGLVEEDASVTLTSATVMRNE